jgi:ABC-type transport system involved in multi-copper enzyme maturation permease subunit
MQLREQFKLMRWELEEYTSFPMLEVLIVVAIYSVLTMPMGEMDPAKSYSNLHWGIQTVFLFLIFTVGALVSHSFAGSFGKGETKLLLSYPVKRSQLFLSKFTALFLVLSAVYGAVFSAQFYLLSLSPLEPLFYVSLLGVLLQLLLFCSITVTFSLALKNEIISILASILLLYGLENVVSAGSIWSSTGQFKVVFGYFGLLAHGELPSGLMIVPTIENFALAVCIPLAISGILLTASFLYFNRIMEID